MNTIASRLTRRLSDTVPTNALTGNHLLEPKGRQF